MREQNSAPAELVYERSVRFIVERPEILRRTIGAKGALEVRGGEPGPADRRDRFSEDSRVPLEDLGNGPQGLARVFPGGTATVSGTRRAAP